MRLVAVTFFFWHVSIITFIKSFLHSLTEASISWRTGQLSCSRWIQSDVCFISSGEFCISLWQRSVYFLSSQSLRFSCIFLETFYSLSLPLSSSFNQRVVSSDEEQFWWKTVLVLIGYISLNRLVNFVFYWYECQYCVTYFDNWVAFLQGSCRVLKKLKKVESRLTEHQERVVGFERGEWQLLNSKATPNHVHFHVHFHTFSLCVFNLVSSRITRSTEQFNKLRLTISALSAFKPKNQNLIPSNDTEISASSNTCRNTCNSQCNCEKQQEDAIDKVAMAQVSERGRTSDEMKKKVPGTLLRNTRRKSLPVGSRKVRVSAGCYHFMFTHSGL